MKTTVHHMHEVLVTLTSFHPPKTRYIHPERQLRCPTVIPMLIEQIYEQLYPHCFTSGYRIKFNGRVSQPLGWDELLGSIAAILLTGKFHYIDSFSDAYEDEQRIKSIQRRMGPLLDFPEGFTSWSEINWGCVEK